MPPAESSMWRRARPYLRATLVAVLTAQVINFAWPGVLAESWSGRCVERR